jgi:hypothetical protein
VAMRDSLALGLEGLRLRCEIGECHDFFSGHDRYLNQSFVACDIESGVHTGASRQ